MATVKTFRGKGGPLTFNEIDDNTDNLNNDKIERVVSVSDSAAAIEIIQAGSGAGIVINANEFVVDGTGKVGIGTASPTVALDLSVKTDAIAIPSGSTAQRPAGSQPAIRHNTTTGQPEYNFGSSWGPLSAPIPNVQVFNSNGTFTVPAGVTKIKVTVVGGGGGAGYNNGTSPTSGAAGGAVIGVLSVAAGDVFSVVVGAAGVANQGSVEAGTAGGTSSFGSGLTATGGSGGPLGVATSAGGQGSGGYLNLRGGSGYASGNSSVSAVGGNSILGGGGGSSTQTGITGGGGATRIGKGGGGNGGPGIVIVEW